jgi:hypothetical protein
MPAIRRHIIRCLPFCTVIIGSYFFCCSVSSVFAAFVALRASWQAAAALQDKTFLSPQAVLEAVRLHVTTSEPGFDVYMKSKGKSTGPPRYWIVCHCADKPPTRASELKPDVKRRNVKPCIKSDCKWRIVVQPQIGPNENTADNGSSADSALKWCLTLPPSFTDGHNHALDYVHNKAVVAGGDGSSRIITKADLTEQILSDARTWSSVPTVHGKALHNAVLCHHFGGDLNAVFEPTALNALNNIAADVRARAAFTKGDSKNFIAALNDVRATGGYAVYDLAEDCTFRRAFWATQDQVERANEFGLDVIMQVSDSFDQLGLI